MKRIFTLIALACLTAAGWAQAVTDRASAGSPLTFDEFTALAGTGKHFAIVGSSSNTQFCYPNWFGFSTTFVGTLDKAHLFDLERSTTGDGWYNIKRVSDGNYVSAEGGNFDASTKLDFKPVKRLAGDYAAEFANADLHVSLDNAAGNHYNCNTVNLGFRGGTGGYSTYITYGPFYVVNVQYVDASNNPVQDPAEMIVKAGATIEAPQLAGYTIQVTGSATADADKTITFTYASSTYDYTVVINGAVEGTAVTVKNEAVSNGGSVTSQSAITENDVVVTFPAGYDYMKATVTISGTTITVKCEDGRWPINFSKDQKYIRTDRFITNVRIGDKTFDITNDGLNTPAYRDLTDQVLVVPAGATLVPAIGYQGQWMHGFFYVDLDNDGAFYVANPDHQTAANTEYNGELLSYANQGNALNSSKQEMPAFTMPTTPGDYRARFKLDWASTDPGGNPGADINDVTSSNHIIANGGTIVDITLRILSASEVTYVVVDESNNELFRSPEAEKVGIGEVITTLPEKYQRSGFYDYNTISLTVSEAATTATFTATPKAAPLVKYTADATAPVWYKLKLKDAYYPVYVADGADNVQAPSTDDDTNNQWAFIGSPYAGFQIINRAAGTGLVLGSATTIGIADSGANIHASLAAPGSKERELWSLTPSTFLTGGFFIYNADGHALNYRDPGTSLAYWTNGADLGSTFTAEEVLEGEALYNQLLAQIEAVNWGTGLNEYQVSGDLAGYAGNEAALIAQLKSGYSEQNLAAAQLMLANYALNLPAAGFYRIKGQTSSKYLAAGLASNNKFAMSDATDASTIFYFDGTTLTNFSSGLSNGMNTSAWAWVTGDAASQVTFQDGQTNGGYAILSNNAHFYDNGDNSSSADRGGNLTINASTNARYTSWYLEAVTELPVALDDGGDDYYYATLCLPYAAALTEAEAYTLSKDGTELNMSEPSTTVAAGTPVLLVAQSASATATITPAAEAADIATGGTLVGTYLPIAFDGATHYVLGSSEDKVGFFHWDGETLTGFRAYIAGEAGSGVKGYYLNNDIVTRISQMLEAKAGKGTYYDLSGRRVAQPTRGLYIGQGRKVVVK